MKSLIILTVIFLIGCDMIREVKPPEEYSKVITTTMTQKEVYAKIMNWATTNFVGSNRQIILNDKDNGIVSLSGYIDNLYMGMVYGKFILKIQIKDYKYRILIVNANAYANGKYGEYLTYYNKDALNTQNIYFELLFKQIENSVKNTKSEW